MSKNICIFGDSITWGVYDPKNGGWVTLLRNNLEPDKLKVYNCGVCGADTGDLLKRFKIEAEARRPKIIIFAIGVQDSQYTETKENPRVSTDDFKRNLKELVKQARKFTEKIIFIGIGKVDESKIMPIPWGSGNTFYDNENVEIYNNIIKEVSNNEKLDSIDLKDTINIDDLHDGLHPNSVGHEKIFVKVKDFLTANKWI